METLKRNLEAGEGFPEGGVKGIQAGEQPMLRPRGRSMVHFHQRVKETRVPRLTVQSPQSPIMSLSPSFPIKESKATFTHLGSLSSHTLFCRCNGKEQVCKGDLGTSPSNHSVCILSMATGSLSYS